jgi:cysteinyl-tRNA synthetase
MSLKVYNTLEGNKVEFQPRVAGEVGLYVCGPTVYDSAHLGHARAAVVFDMVVRYLREREFVVRYVRNYTDVDDKIITRANERGEAPGDLAERYVVEFESDMADLGVLDPDEKPRVTTHIPEIIALIEKLVANGNAYAVEGDVYFSVSSFADYGKLSNRDQDAMIAGARVEVDLKKRSPLDFALWKKAKSGEPAWESPWGPGRPGWHIECSAMSMKYLGETFDIHGGGRDLVFPHHENEIAQSEACTHKPFARYWLHNGFVNINAEKMSKSLGNFLTIRELIGRYHAETIRLFLLSAHYRTPIDFTLKIMEDGERQLERFYNALAESEKYAPDSPELNLKDITPAAKELWYLVDDLPIKVRDAMDDDFNTASAIGHVYDVIREINKVVIPRAGYKPDPGDPFFPGIIHEARKRLRQAGRSLGIFQAEPQAYLADLQSRRLARAGLSADQVQKLVEERTAARKAKDFARADELRKQLTEMTVEIEDKPEGTVWRMG